MCPVADVMGYGIITCNTSLILYEIPVKTVWARANPLPHTGVVVVEEEDIRPFPRQPLPHTDCLSIASHWAMSYPFLLKVFRNCTSHGGRLPPLP